MIRLSLVLSTVLAASLAAPLSAAPDISPYVQAWQNHDTKALLKVLGNAGYFDADRNQALDGADLTAYLDGLRTTSWMFLGAKDLPSGKVELSWSGSGPAGNIAFTDVLTYEGGKLTDILTQGSLAPPAEADWADSFAAARKDGTNPALAAFFTPTARVFGRTFPSSGATVPDYLKVLESIAGTVYSRLADSPVRKAKDGHLYYNFQLLWSNGSVFIGGRDHLYLKDGLVDRFVGVY